MTNFDKIRKETETPEGMAKLFISMSWDGTGRCFSYHNKKYFDTEDDAIAAEVEWLKCSFKEE